MLALFVGLLAISLASMWTGQAVGPGRQLYNAAEKGEVAAVKSLADEWRGNTSVINWINPAVHGLAPLHIGSAMGMIGAVQVLIDTPGE